MLALGLCALGGLALRNELRFPVLARFPVPAGGGDIVIYDRGFRHRAADVFYEPSPAAPPVYVAPLFYAGTDLDGHPRQRPEFLAWTAGGSGIFAARQGTERDRISPDDVLWLFDTRLTRLALGAAAAAALEQAGGPGPITVFHYDLGRKDPDARLRSWETTRWEQARP